MDAFYELKEMLCKELEELVRKGELSAGDLQAVDLLTHSIKSIVTIMAMEEGGYSNEGSYGSYEGGNNGGGNSNESYGSYNGSYNSYARGGRGSGRGRGGYSRDGMSGRYSGRRYSRDEAASEMVHEFERLMEDAPNKEVREVIQRAVQQLKNM